MVLVKEFNKWGMVYKIEFSWINPYSNERWESILQIGTFGSTSSDCGFSLPSIEGRRERYSHYIKVHVCLNGRLKKFQHEVSGSGSDWHKTSVSQNENSLFEVAIDDHVVTSEKNTQPQIFDKVNVYLSSPFDTAFSGQVKDLKIGDYIW